MKNVTTQGKARAAGGIKPDDALKDFWRDNERFADLFNQMLFGGQDFLDPRRLTEQDTDESTVYGRKGTGSAGGRRRDVIKMYGEEVDLVLLSIENQQEVHYAMPVRTMGYDVRRYEKQCRELANRNRREKKYQGKGEYLSGVLKGDRMKAVITLVLYYGEAAWDGPLNLWDMMEVPEVFRKWVNNYQVHLVRVREAARFDFKNADNRDFFDIIKEFYSQGNRMRVAAFREKYEKAETVVSGETLAAIGAVTGSRKILKLAEENEKEVGTMWDIFEEMEKMMVEEAREEAATKEADKLNRLNSLLVNENKMDELKRSVSDRAFQTQLYEKYHIG